jgi:hypothetical protein
MTVLARRWLRKGSARSLQLEATSASTRLSWDAPATTVSVAGVHGGAGSTTLCLLLAHAITRFGAAPTLAVDLAGRARGGLAVLGQANGQTTAEATALLTAADDACPSEPFGVNDTGVRIVGTYPDGIDEFDRDCETLVRQLVEAVDRGADDSRLGGIVRVALRDAACRRAVRWDNDELSEGVGSLLDQAFLDHALVVIDLGIIDSEPLARAVGVRTDLHVWAVPGRVHSLETAERRLPLSSFETAGREAIAVWRDGDVALSARRLSGLGDLRGCPVVRVGNHGGEGLTWDERLLRCLSGVEELCELAR